MVLLRELEKQQKTQFKISGKKEIKIRTEINRLQTKK
jgi:hypothetical protein